MHQATYQFADRAALDRGTDLNSEGMKGLIAAVRPRLAGRCALAGNFHTGG